MQVKTCIENWAFESSVFTFCFAKNMKPSYFDKFWKEHVLENLDVKVDIDEYWFEEEFFHWDLVKIDIMEHRHYNFLHDFDLKREYLTETYEKWDYYYEERKEEQKRFKKIQKDYWLFWLDFFDHSVIWFTLSAKRMNIGYYELDRSRNVGYIAIKRRRGLTREKALKRAEETIEEYNNYINGWIYHYDIWDENWEIDDSCGGFYTEEYARQECIESIKRLLKSKWIEFSKVTID